MNQFEKSKSGNEKYWHFTGQHQPRQPLVCCICDNYFQNPCLLSCYHSFCARCLENRTNNGAIFCPLCGTQTESEDGRFPSDTLLKKLTDLFNVDNPPCANCDKRDPTSMFFCSTCNQSLCNVCREKTHRAKMFSTHEVLPVSKFSQEGQKKCIIHGEPYVMYSITRKELLCVNCFRDMPAEIKQQCIDVDAAYTQAVMKFESVIAGICETQNSVRDGIIMCRTQLDELLHNTDSEKMIVHSFAQGLQEAINKTQNSVLMEVQRQYEIKERSFRNQLVSLSIVLPILQQHIALSQTFSSVNKFQFLDIVFSFIDRLTCVSSLPRFMKSTMTSQIRANYRSEFAQCIELWVGRLIASSIQQNQEAVYESTAPPKTQIQNQIAPTFVNLPSQKQQSALKVKALAGDGPFSNHCRSFNHQVKELGVLSKNIRDRLGELRKDVTVLRRSATPPLVLRHQVIKQDCNRLNDNLEQTHVELERLKSVFQTIWQEQLYRIHVEQDIFQQQMTDVVSLRGEVKQLTITIQNLEPYVNQLTSCGETSEIAKLKSLLDEISQLKDPQKFPGNKPFKGLSRKHCQSSMSLIADTKSVIKDDLKRDCRNSVRGERAHSVSEQKTSRGVFSQLIDKVRSSKDKPDGHKERSKSVDRLKECTNQGCQKVYAACSESNMRIKQKRSSNVYCNFNDDEGNKGIANFAKGQKLNDRDERCEFQPKFHPESAKEKEKYVGFHWQDTQLKGVEKKESDYQTITEATSMFQSRNAKCYSSDEEDFYSLEKRTKPCKKSAPPSPPPRTSRKRYPHSDTEESIFYADTISRSLPTDGSTKDGKAIFLVIGRRKMKRDRRVQKQRSWETFPPKKKLEDVSSGYYTKNPDNYKSQFDIVTLQSETVKKADSFEGHEEAVSSLVCEFQKIRMLQKQKQNSQAACDKDV